MANMTRIDVVGTGFPSAPGLNSWYFTSDDFTAMTSGEVDGALAAVRAFYDAVKSMFATVQGFQVISPAVQFDPANGEITGEQGTVVPALVSGTTAVAVGPPQVCILARLNTATAVDGRIVRGRVYLGPFSKNITVAATPEVANVNAVQAALVTLLAAGGAAWKSAVWHRPLPVSPGLPLGRAGTAVKVANSNVSLSWATQRRRNL